MLCVSCREVEVDDRFALCQDCWSQTDGSPEQIRAYRSVGYLLSDDVSEDDLKMIADSKGGVELMIELFRQMDMDVKLNLLKQIIKESDDPRYSQGLL